MKLNAFLTSILPAEAFPDNDLAAVLGASALKEIEVPDAVASKFNSHYMTKDRAINDPDIAKELKGRHFGHFADLVEGDLKDIMGKAPQEFQDRYFAVPKDKPNGIHERLKIAREAVAHIAEKGSGEDLKTATKKWRDTEAELRGKITDYESKITNLSNEFAVKEKDIKVDYALRSKLEGLIPKLDQNYFKTPVQKNFLIDSTINGLRKGYKLDFDKENQSNINLYKQDGTDLYEGNTKVTLEKYLEKELEPYTVKNNGGTQKQNTSTQSQQTPIHNGEMTLEQKRWAAAS